MGGGKYLDSFTIINKAIITEISLGNCGPETTHQNIDSDIGFIPGYYID